MARANRHILPGHVWHITHRCHKREFLLKFAKDRKRWVKSVERGTSDAGREDQL
jgi:REP element-mobilizing transposase RayT